MITLELLRHALTEAPARQRGEQAKNTQIVHQTIARLYGVPDGRAE